MAPISVRPHQYRPRCSPNSPTDNRQNTEESESSSRLASDSKGLTRSRSSSVVSRLALHLLLQLRQQIQPVESETGERFGEKLRAPKVTASLSPCSGDPPTHLLLIGDQLYRLKDLDQFGVERARPLLHQPRAQPTKLLLQISDRVARTSSSHHLLEVV